MIEGVKKHAIGELVPRVSIGRARANTLQHGREPSAVLVVAFLFATYHIVQLESGRNNHRANVEEGVRRCSFQASMSTPHSPH
jgi:hypothetical protein